MDNVKSVQGKDIIISDLYPQLNEEQLREAEDNLEKYLDFVLRLYERIQNDPQAYSVFKNLTASGRKQYDEEQKVESSP